MSEQNRVIKKRKLDIQLFPINDKEEFGHANSLQFNKIQERMNEIESIIDSKLLNLQNKVLQHLQIYQKHEVKFAEIYVTSNIIKKDDSSKLQIKIHGSIFDENISNLANSNDNNQNKQYSDLSLNNGNTTDRPNKSIYSNNFNPSENTMIPFTSILNSVLVTFPKQTFNVSIKPSEWKRTSNFIDCNGFLLEKDFDPNLLSKDEFRVNIQLTLGKKCTGLFKTSKELTALLIGEESRKDPYKKHGEWRTLQDIMNHIWLYIQAQQLQDKSDPKVINCDERLKKLLHSETIFVNELYLKLKDHLTASDYIHLRYVVNPLDESNNDHEQIFVRKIPFYHNDSEIYEKIFNSKFEFEIAKLDEEIQQLQRKAQFHEKRRQFMEKFNSNPIDHIYNVIEEQTFHLQMMNSQLEEESRFSSFWKKPWVDQAIDRVLRVQNEDP